MRLIDADKLYLDCTTFWGYPTVGKSQIENAPTISAVLIPEGATNGDVIKALFPNAEFDNAKPFTDGRWETMNLDTENRIRATYKPTQLRTYADWWNAQYIDQAIAKEAIDG